MPIGEREQAFLAQIRDDPFDENLRLVYADWLDEQGDPRGELIRLNTDWNRFYSPWWSADEADAADRRERAEELRRLHYNRWCGEVPADLYVDVPGGLLMVEVWPALDLLPLPAIGRIFHRGRDIRKPAWTWWDRHRTWVMKLSLGRCDDATLAGLIERGWLADIPILRVSGDSVTDVGMNFLRRLQSLRSLALVGTAVTDKGLRDLRRLPRLRELKLDGSRVTGPGLRFLDELPDLRRLGLDNFNLPPEATQHLARLSQLEWLSCEDTRLPGDSAAFLAGMRSLQWLNLQCRSPRGEHLAHLKGLPHLEELRLSREALDPTGLAALEALTSVRRLYVKGEGPIGPPHDSLARLVNLEVLDLDDGRLALEGRRRLSALPRLRCLKAGWYPLVDEVDSAQLGETLPLPPTLESLIIDAVNAETLASLSELPRLRKLVVSEYGLGDEALGHLALLPEVTELGFRFYGDGNALAALARLPKLGRLFLQGEGFRLDHLAGLGSLRALMLAKSDLSDSDLAVLTDLIQLRELSLWKAPVSGVTFVHLWRLPNLSRLDCMLSCVSDVSLDLLGELAALASVNLCGTNVTDAGLEHLARIPQLREVFLDDEHISRPAVAELRTRRPDMRVVHV